MEWQDQGIIISVKKFSEKQLIITSLTLAHGLHAGIMRDLSKHRSTLQIGNIVNLVWNARLSDHLGYYDIELIEVICPLLYHDQKRLLALSSLCEIVNTCLKERIIETDLYLLMVESLQSLKNNDNWYKKYVIFELELLAKIGFGIDFSACAATGVKTDLCYISPKSARVVSKIAGLPYHDKLLVMPGFFLNYNIEASKNDIINGLKITGYFLYKHAFEPHNYKLPESRTRLISLT